MRLILALFPIVMIAKDGFGYNIDFGSRLSGKNILLYGALVLIALRMAQQRKVPTELAAIHAGFVALIGYAVLSWWIVSSTGLYPNYPAIENGVLLKILLIDRYLIFLAFFLGVRTHAEAMWVLRALLLVVAAAHLVTVGESIGLLPTNFVQERPDGRVSGLFGGPNQYGPWSLLFLPAFIAMAAISRGLMRKLWLSAALLGTVAFFLTFSRGAIVAMIVAAIAGLFMFGRYLSAATLVRGLAALTVAVGLSIATAAVYFFDALQVRVDDTFQSGNVEDLSKGRAGIWIAALTKMLEEPVTFLTGFGWLGYYELPHVLAPHNTYLDFWFNLGLPGLLSFSLIFFGGIEIARRAAISTAGANQAVLAAFVVGAMVVAVSLFFTEWYEPWTYFWAYFGLAMRLAVLAKGAHPESDASARAADEGSSTHRRRGASMGQYGWSLRPSTRRKGDLSGSKGSD